MVKSQEENHSAMKKKKNLLYAHEKINSVDKNIKQNNYTVAPPK